MSLFTRETMLAFIQEALPEAALAAVEKATRDSPVALALHRELLSQNDAGEHSVGGVWRRERLSCPAREQLGKYLLQAGDVELFHYIDFHLTVVGCELCSANLDDLRQQQKEKDKTASRRRKQIFASSAGLIPGPRR